MSLNQMLEHLRKFTEVDTEIVYGPSRAGDVKHSLADITKARELLGYDPLISAEKGLGLSVQWYRAIRKE